MKVIAAGFPKTGTKSLNTALTILGYNVYDFIENGLLLHDEWKKIFNEGWTTEMFRRMYENIDAVVDVPACYFWEEIHKAFPDAKIILTVRDDEDIWYRSLDKYVRAGDDNMTFRLMQLLSPTQLKLLRVAGYSTGTTVFGDKRIFDAKWFGRKVNEQLLKLKYRAHNAYVLQNAPKDKLLVFKVSEGWGPLCKFLDVPIPNVPFPHKNSGANIKNEFIETHPLVTKMNREILISFTVILTVSLFVGVSVYKKGIRGVASVMSTNLNRILEIFGWHL